ncbi:MAG TPA: bifunctional pyr operon transcriptional regulator/uracil phosphoribosyltransferase, partial [Acidimicrobiaceae bacterium]|nr:bifunctional pyr operon transcriptional regulator/uracil phosphoribosyltransferase [Acidimicrobiaceae bacterium]
MSADDMGRAILRMAHEVIERNHGLEGVVVVGLQTGGVPVAERLVDAIEGIEGIRPPLGCLDVALYRDDIGIRPVVPEAATALPADIDN